MNAQSKKRGIKRVHGLLLTLLLLPGLILSSCKKEEEPLLIADVEETGITEAWEDESDSGSPDHLSPDSSDQYFSSDFDRRCDINVCESETRIYYVCSGGVLDNFREHGQKSIYYADKQSGVHGVLCSREGCDHRETDCPGVLGNDSLISLALYEGKLLAAFSAGSNGEKIRILSGNTDGSGFSELGTIVKSSFEAAEENSQIASVCFHRGYCYVLSTFFTENTPEESAFPVFTELSSRLTRFSLDNLNLSEELCLDTLHEAWNYISAGIEFDRDDVYLITHCDESDPESYRRIVRAGERILKIQAGKDPEVLYSGEVPVFGAVMVRDGEVQLYGRSIEKSEGLLLVLDPEKRQFHREQSLGIFPDDGDFFSSFMIPGDGYYIQSIVEGFASEKDPETETCQMLRFYGENGQLFSEKTLKFSEILQKLNLNAAEFEDDFRFTAKCFAMDQDVLFESLNIIGMQKSTQILIRIPVEEGEDWSLLFSDSSAE
ncbi:MAG: hypothetical protein IKS18_03490 [Lachnospiraceae bacterium]|nr:hypothetical protein [Lachnospiraceae bacterium]